MTCALGGGLQDSETSYAKFGAPEYDRSLPEAAERLVLLPTEDGVDAERQDVRRCPRCGALYEYLRSHEYMIDGTEDEGLLTRMPAERAAAYRLAQARRLESLRRDVGRLRDAAASLGDYLDRGRPGTEEEREA